MDYSTISNKTALTEAEEVTNGELSERYYLLKKQLENLTSCHEATKQELEATKQELHDTRRSCQTALDVQSHLTMELETLQSEEAKRRNDLTSRITALQEDISKLEDERTETSERHSAEIKKLQEELRHKDERAYKEQRQSPELDTAELEEAKLALSAAVSDACSAKAALEAARSEMVSWRMRAEELVGAMGEMRAAADVRREELRASNEREAAALADLAEARALLHQCTDSQDLQPHAAKGNSIFAEVEDKRQEMAKNLIQMKQTNSRLRRELAAKQSELEALLHEKETVWEMQAGDAALHDRELLDSYEERITQLEGACERQRREWARWFGKHCDAAAPGWLPGVMDHLKSECEQLRAEVLARGAAKLASAAQIRELRRKVAALAAGAKHATSPLATPLDNSQQKEVEVLKSIDTNVLNMRPIEGGISHVKERPRLTPEDVKKKVSFN